MIGQKVAHYEILEKIGEGGMGVVYRARDLRLNRDVALKFLPADFSASEELKERFLQEAQAASALDHPNICTIHAIEETAEGRLFIAMAYYEGETLKSKLKRGALETEEIVDLVAQIATGLEAAHERGILHMDIKPANLMITRDGTVKILDFGLSRFTSEADRSRPAGPLMGTVGYMSPERVQGKQVGPESDVWSLGVVLYELLTGERPFHGSNDMSTLYSIVHREAVPAIERVPDIPTELDTVIRRALVKDRRSRYRTMAELLHDLEPLRESSQVLTKTFPWIVGYGRRPHQLLGLLAVAMFTVVAVLAFFWSPAPSPAPGVKRQLVLLDLGNGSAGGDVDWLGVAVSELVSFELMDDRKRTWLRPESTGPVSDAQLTALQDGFDAAHGFDATALAEVRQQASVESVVGGTLLATGDVLEVKLVVQDTEDPGDRPAVIEASGRLDGLPALAVELADELADELDLEGYRRSPAAGPPAAGSPAAGSPAAGSRDPSADVLPPEAAKLLEEARRELRLYDAPKAREALTRALELGPGSVALHTALAETHQLLGRQDDYRQAAARAVELSRGRPLAERVYPWVLSLEAHAKRRSAAALMRFLWLDAEGLPTPLRVDRGLRAAALLWQAGDNPAALEILATLEELAPDDPRVYIVESDAVEGSSHTERLEKILRAAELAASQDAPLLLARARYLEGDAQWLLGRYSEAEAALQAAADIYSAHDHQLGQAYAFFILGNVRLEIQDLLGAKSSYESAARFFGALGNHRMEARTLGNQALALRMRGDLDAAQEIFRRAAGLATDGSDLTSQAWMLTNYGEALSLTGRLDEAEGAYRDAYALVERGVLIPVYGATVLSSMGEFHLLRGELTAARQKLTRALDLQDELDDDLGRSISLTYLGQLQHLEGNLVEALGTFEQAIALVEGEEGATESATIEVLVLLSWGDALLANGRLADARASYQKILDMEAASAETFRISAAQLGLASLSIEGSRFDRAEDLIREAMADLSRSGAALQTVRAHTLLARIHFLRHQLDRAEEEIELGRQVLGDVEAPPFRLPLDILAARIRAFHGDLKGARDDLQRVLVATTAGGLGELDLETRLALAELELASGTSRSGWTRLKRIEEEARQKGFLLIAEKAQRAAGNKP